MLQQGGVGAKIFSAGLGGKRRKTCPGAELQAGLGETVGAEGERGTDGEKRKGAWGPSRPPPHAPSHLGAAGEAAGSCCAALWAVAAHMAVHPQGTGHCVLTDAFNIG